MSNDTHPRGTEDACGAVLALCDRAVDLASNIAGTDFVATSPEFCDSTIGQHLRHCLDHFDSFLQGLEQGAVDYDTRARDDAEETSPDTARARATNLRTRLAESLASRPLNRRIKVRSACTLEGEVTWHESTLGRELQFLVSHTVHHFAMLAAIAHHRGIPTPKDLGVAPSTLRWRAKC